MKKYTASNVSVAGGGHGVLARLFATLQVRGPWLIAKLLLRMHMPEPHI